jgi:prepilin-type processing-associated H-X9-DG protein
VVRTEGDLRAVIVSGVPIAQYRVGDRMSEAYAMVQLVQQGWAEQAAVARGFGCSARTLRRHARRFESGGLAALGRRSGYPPGRLRLRTSWTKQVHELKADGRSNRAIAQRMGVSEKAIRNLLRRMGWKEERPAQARLACVTEAPGAADANVSASSRSETALACQNAPLPANDGRPTAGAADANLSGASVLGNEALPVSFDQDPSDRRVDRLLASLGLLDDAAPLFRPGERVDGAGVLLALPALLASGVLDIAREVYGSLAPAFYGLRTTLVAFLLMSLLRIKRPEGLKEHSPDDLGRILGLDRAPEVKTLRRKFARLAVLGRAAELGRALARRRVATHGGALGFLYIDGHVRAYHGQHAIPKAHVARMRLSMPATTDYWVGDERGDPLFLVTAEANAGMVRMLPPILDEIRTLVGRRRTTVIFDRGGFSPDLFHQILAAGFEIITYRKQPQRRVPGRLFREYQVVRQGRRETMLLADQNVRLRRSQGQLRLRQITRLSADGKHQTPILTSRHDLAPAEIATRMFDRWRQENFFKYLREEYAIDALAEYATEPDDPERDVPNPKRQAIDAQIREARAALTIIQARYGIAAHDNPEAARPTIRGFKIAHGKIGKELRVAMRRVTTFEARRASIPARVPLRLAVDTNIVKLAPERQMVVSLLKMVAFQAESDLVRQVAPHYKRADDEGRTHIQNALAAHASIAASDSELRITLQPLSSPHRTAAIASLCHQLNQTKTPFPGTRLLLRFDITRPDKSQ